MARSTQLLPIRMVMDLYRIRPPRSRLEDEPLVQIQGMADMSADFGAGPLPVWFDAQIKFFKDGSFNIVEISPTYGGSIGSSHNANIFEVYKVALKRAIERNTKKMVGVS
jgi:hypothetical protein